MAAISGDVPAALDYRAFALKRAGQLGVFAGQPSPSIFEDDGTRAPTTTGSLLQASLITGAGTVAVLPAEAGGAWKLTTAGTSGASTAVVAGAGTTGAGLKPGMISDPGAAGSRWYLFAVFRISTTADAQTFVSVGFRPSDNTSANTIQFGVDGVFLSTTKLMAEENVSSSTLSTINIGSSSTWHYLEAWQMGTANQIFFRFDGEPPLTLTTTVAFSAKGTLFAAVGNGTTMSAKTADIDHVVVLMPGTVTLPI